MSKKERLVAAIENGTVIDHIPSEKTYEVANILDLQNLDTIVTIGYNYLSKKIGRKGIIKIENKFFYGRGDIKVVGSCAQCRAQHYKELRGCGKENRGDPGRAQRHR